ncbi:MAG: M20/M25/M40 family metallo-hydrolase [Planctomycetaceae bacterium]
MTLFNHTDAIQLVTDLIAIPGKSTQEGRVIQFLRDALSHAGVSDSQVLLDDANQRSSAGGEVGNLIVKLPGTKRGPRRLLMAHVDTVPLAVGAKPIREGEIIKSADPNTALGGDDRAGAAVLLNTLLTILKQKLPHPPLTFFWPVQEEIGLLGARHVQPRSLGNPKLCFNWDGGAAHAVAIGATGAYDLNIDVFGTPAHAGAHPEQGASAIAMASLAIADLTANGWHGLIVKGKQRGTSNVGLITGGEATNVVTPHVRVRAEARSHDPKFRLKIVKAFRDAFTKAVQQVRTDAGQPGRADFRSELKYESFQLPLNEPSVAIACDAIRAAGLEPETRISNGGLDANWLTAHGLPTVTLGCGQAGIHTTDEILHLGSYLKACEIALRLSVL